MENIISVKNFTSKLLVFQDIQILMTFPKSLQTLKSLFLSPFSILYVIEYVGMSEYHKRVASSFPSI